MKPVYKIYVNDRGYTSWEVFETTTFKKMDFDIHPIEQKLFSNDVFTFDEKGNIIILHSTVRSGPPSPGVLILQNNKTYGRNTSGNNKLLYKCIPDDKRLPAFLVPYEIKNIGFSKSLNNVYVTFKYDNWDGKHPRATLGNIIGEVDVLDNFYEYQLYCKSLNASIQQFQRATTNALQDKSHETIIENIKNKYTKIEDRTDWNIITIDPPKSCDYDDGYSIREHDDGTLQLSIYISNVTIWMDILNLWDSFSRRISTIYLPDKKRPMLPTILSDCLCSLQENHTRIAFVMDAYIKDNDIFNIQFSNAFIKVRKNYRYEEPSLLENPMYTSILNVTKKLSKKFKYIPNVRNSNEVVCYLMILMNYHCANKLIDNKTGIFRSTIMKNTIDIPNSIPEDVAKFMKIWNSASGQYVDGSLIANDKNIRHELLDMEAYIHITSPIRRLVDLLNILKFQQIHGIIELSENSQKFYEKWVNDLEYINITMRAIRKIQCDCNLLDICSNSPDVLDKTYKGYLFDRINRNDGLYQFIVYLPDLKLSSRITLRENIDNFECRNFKLFLFNDEESFKRKIRIQLIE